MSPRRRSPSRSRTAARNPGPRIIALTLALLLAGCGTSADEATGPATAGDDPAATADADGAPTPAPDTGPGVGAGTDADGADPLQVLLGVVVLTTGDVDAAVAEGLVTPAELDLAEAAIAAREVSLWLARADLLIAED